MCVKYLRCSFNDSPWPAKECLPCPIRLISRLASCCIVLYADFDMLSDCFLPQFRSFAAVLFRRIASKTRKNDQGETVEIFISLPTPQTQVIRQKLLEVLSAEADRSVRNKISDAIAEVARQYTDNGQLSNLLKSPPSAMC